MPTLTTSDLSGLHTEEHGYALGGGGGGVLGQQYDTSLKQAANNQEVFRRINALLDDTLDLNALSGLTHGKQAPAKDINTGLDSALSYRPGSNLPTSLEHLLGNLNTGTQLGTQLGTQIGSTAPLMQGIPDLNQYGSGSLYSQDLGLGTQQLASYPTYYTDVTGLPGFTTGYQMPAMSTSHMGNQPMTSFAPTSVSGITSGRGTPNLIQGAISNRTLEQLTETLTRPCRPIKGDTSKLHTGLGAEVPNTFDAMNYHPYPTYDSAPQQGPHQYSALQQQSVLQPYPLMQQQPPQESNLSRLFTRAPTPGTDPEPPPVFSNDNNVDATANALVDLMNTLSLTSQPPVTSQQPPSSQQPAVNQLDLLRALNQNTDLLSRRPEGLNSGLNDIGDKMRSLNANGLNTLLTSTNNTTDPYAIEKAAKLYRSAATVCEATCTWSGQLPPKIYKNATYSCKVFLGGVPWDITETGLQHAFKQFGTIKIEWPGKEGKHPRYPTRDGYCLSAGYVYVLFETPKAVAALLQSCTQDFSSSGEYFFKISSRRMRSKEVQVIPWVLSDSNFVRQPSQRLDPNKTVFVGALHGVLTAEALSNIMNDLFGSVVYAGIDTDKHKYPIGSGRVTFSSHKSYMKAVNAAFVEIKTPKFTKKIQIDPYLEDSLCSVCALQQGPFFCRDLICFRYYCRTCWQWTHAFELMQHHKPLMRNSRGNATHTSVV